jgi:hypothetical protein
MQERTIEFTELPAKNYYKRVLHSFCFPGVSIFFGYIFVRWFSASSGTSLLFALIAFIHFLFCAYKNRFYITRVAWNKEGQLFMTYFDFNTVKYLNTRFSAIVVYKGLLWQRNSRQYFLALKWREKENNMEVRQFTVGAWTGVKFDELLKRWNLATLPL